MRPKYSELAAFKQIPINMCETPKMMAIFILKALKNWSPLKLPNHL